jgi:hypothetical protein
MRFVTIVREEGMGTEISYVNKKTSAVLSGLFFHCFEAGEPLLFDADEIQIRNSDSELQRLIQFYHVRFMM